MGQDSGKDAYIEELKRQIARQEEYITKCHALIGKLKKETFQLEADNIEKDRKLKWGTELETALRTELADWQPQDHVQANVMAEWVLGMYSDKRAVTGWIDSRGGDRQLAVTHLAALMQTENFNPFTFLALR